MDDSYDGTFGIFLSNIGFVIPYRRINDRMDIQRAGF